MAEQGIDQELAQLTRLYAALTRINQAIARLPIRQELFTQVCDALVEEAGFRMAWVGWHDPTTCRLIPVAVSGDGQGYLSGIDVRTDLQVEGLGPSGTAFRQGSPAICNDVDADDCTLPWRAALRRNGFRASAALPIRADGVVAGTLNVYADVDGRFRQAEMALLVEAAADVSAALDALRKEGTRRDLEVAVRSEQQFSSAMIESLPGIVYFYDEDRRLLRWNRNFMTVSGYTPDELARMGPLDFFRGDDRARVDKRIGEVFDTGESSVEADFITKDGRAIPYFFTGRRVVFSDKVCLVGTGIDMADRIRAERQLRDSESKYRELVELANSIILRWDVHGRVRFLNDFGLRFFGYREEEILGRDVIGTLVPIIESGGRDLEKLMARVRADPGSFERNINENVRRSGERIWISWTNRIVRDDRGDVAEILSVGNDITEQVHAEQARRVSEERHRSTLESILEACQLIGFDWRYLYLNSAAERQNRRSNQELLGKTMQEAWPGIEHSDVFRLLQSSMQEREARHAEVVFDFPDGTQGWFDLRCQPAPEGLFVLSIDITERMRAQLRLRELNESLERTVSQRTEQLQEALHRAEAADRMKSAFLATMSHELRTPLNSIIGFTGIVLRQLAGPLTEEQTRQLGMVRSSAHHLLELINDVLDLSKLEAGQLVVRHDPFEIRDAATHVIETVAPLAERKALALRLHIAPDLGRMIGDRRRVEQILLNLLNNAIKFTDHGHVELLVDRVIDKDRAMVRAQVRDTGIGMAAADLSTLFQPFRQLDTGLARQHEGTGLGLAICRRLTDMMHGLIAVESEPGAGSVFTVTLPEGVEEG